MHNSAITKSAAAIALAALATFGVTACSGGGSSNASDSKSSSSSKKSSTPKAGLATKVQCAELQAKLSDSESGLESAMGNVSSADDVAAAIPKLQGFQKDLHTEVGKITDPALKQSAGKFDTDYSTMITTITTLLNDVKTGNSDDATTQESSLQTQTTALQADADALQKTCG